MRMIPPMAKTPNTAERQNRPAVPTQLKREGRCGREIDRVWAGFGMGRKWDLEGLEVRLVRNEDR